MTSNILYYNRYIQYSEGIYMVELFENVPYVCMSNCNQCQSVSSSNGKDTENRERVLGIYASQHEKLADAL